MDLASFVTNFLIFTGALLMAFNIKKFKDIADLLRRTATTQYTTLKPLLLFHHFLIVSFFVGYIVVLIALNSTELSVGNLFVGIIFISGSVFVLLGTFLQKKMIESMEKAYRDAIGANKKLFNNEKILTDTNVSLTQEIERHRITEANLQRSYDTQTVVNQILKESLTDTSIMEVVNHSLDLLLSLPWLAFEFQGSIHLVDDTPDVLVLKAQRGFSKELEEKCRRIPFGTCLCGRAAVKRETVYAANIDARHDILFDGIQDHGHYCIPILAKGVTIGIINIYLKPGHKRDEWEEGFLKAVANTLAIILVQHRADQQKKEIEQRLQQTQKMESIGTLAGGIAHDFNNILSGIFGYIQLAERNLDDPEKVRDKLAQLHKVARRASDLIQQILTFSRNTEYKKLPVKFHTLVQEAARFLRSSIPSSINIVEDISSRGYVMAEPTKIHQIVMNLCTNAAHAMRENGGDLSIILSDIEVEDGTAPDPSLRPGCYVKLEIQDTGTGMPREILDKIFDPYFTTKKVKEGTGLGLSVVLGIVQEHKGYIKTVSKPGQGTSFHLYFPRTFMENDTERPAKKRAKIKGGTERILIVDDEQSILLSISELLKDYGYTVTSFSSAKSAFDAFKKDPGQFDLVITDMTMPEMTGEELSLGILDIRPEFPIILCTGHSDNISKNKALRMGIKKFFQKPVDGTDILILIRKIFEEKK